MNLINLFQPIPFPFRVQTNDPYSLVCENQTPFFDAPSNSKLNDSFWPSITSDGWRVCNQGYSVYSRRIPKLPKHFLVLHGLKIKGIWRSQGKTNGLSIVVDRRNIVSYMDTLLAHFVAHFDDFDEKIENRVRSLVTESIHEIRSMNTSLYHVGYELQGNLQHDDHHNLALSKNIVALSELISARLELADLAASNLVDPILKSDTPIGVHKKFNKIAKCYIAYAKKREISISISGDSRGLVQGVQNFEMIPLVVIDNAVKYSPQKSSIEIAFTEDESKIICEVNSLGPKIEQHELKSIFERESRGIHAISSGQGGSGIGLYFANQLMKLINGTISVDQTENVQQINGKKYLPTVFRLSFEKILAKRIPN